GLGANADRRDLVADLEPDVSHDEAEGGDNSGVDKLGAKLAPISEERAADTVVTDADLLDPVGLRGGILSQSSETIEAVPAGAVLAVGEDAQRDQTPETIDAVDGNRSNRIVN